MERPTLVAFDFDGTITTCDTLAEFLKFTHSLPSRIVRSSLLIPVLLGWKIGLLSGEKAKQRVFTLFFKGWDLALFNRKCEEFSYIIDKYVRPEARNALRTYHKTGADTIIISASPENWIIPWACRNGIRTVIATRLSVGPTGKLTGRFLSLNCYGKEKVNRLTALFPKRDEYILLAYGDSKGDRELLSFADKSYYRTF